MWWNQATEQQKANLKYLYGNGQVEFLIGGIVMNDEAAASYEAIINQVPPSIFFSQIIRNYNYILDLIYIIMLLLIIDNLNNNEIN